MERQIHPKTADSKMNLDLVLDKASIARLHLLELSTNWLKEISENEKNGDVESINNKSIAVEKLIEVTAIIRLLADYIRHTANQPVGPTESFETNQIIHRLYRPATTEELYADIRRRIKEGYLEQPGNKDSLRIIVWCIKNNHLNATSVERYAIKYCSDHAFKNMSYLPTIEKMPKFGPEYFAWPVQHIEAMRKRLKPLLIILAKKELKI